MSDDALERLSKKLDSGKTAADLHRSSIPQRGGEAPSAWQHAPDAPEAAPPVSPRRYKTLEKVFLGSAIFFVASLALAGILIFFGNNTVSTKNVDVQLSGPQTLAGGDTLTLQVVVTNRNSVSIQLADLVIDFPPGTRSDTDVSIPIPTNRITLGTILPGQSMNRTVKAVLFGASGQDLPIKASVEYRVQASNAVFVSTNTYTAHISQSPAAISVSAPKEVVSGQNTPIAITLTSNSPQVLKDMLLVVTYPPGFTLKDANPKATLGSVWDLGDIEPGGTRTIKLNGTFSGEDGDMKTITVSAGSKKSSSDREISAPLAASQIDVTVTKPFVSASIVLNGSVASQHTVGRGQDIQGQIEWANNLPVPVQNLSIQLRMDGQIIDMSRVRAQSGFYSSSNSSIVWDLTTNPDFANVPPGASGALSFTLATLPSDRGTFKNPSIIFTVNVSANRSSEGNVIEAISSTATTKAVVASNVALSASLSHAGNSGPVPPKVDTETVYTASWTVNNSANALGNTQVTATLPNYVRFAGAVSPGGENLSFDKNTSRLTWNVGDIAAGQTRTVSFQVGVTPSVSQIGTMPPVVVSQKVTAFDRYVEGSVQGEAPDLTTASAGTQENGIVSQ